jgi:hypothetical protein
MPKHCILFTNHLSPEVDKEARASIEEVTTHSLNLITSKTRLISCEEEVRIVFIISTLTIASITLVKVGWRLTITFFLFSVGKFLQGSQRPSTHQEHPKQKI